MGGIISTVIDIFKALADANQAADRNSLGLKSPLCVCEIEKLLKLPQNLVSHHLSILKKCGIVEDCRCGKKNYYSLNKEKMINFAEKISELGGK